MGQSKQGAVGKVLGGESIFFSSFNKLWSAGQIELQTDHVCFIFSHIMCIPPSQVWSHSLEARVRFRSCYNWGPTSRHLLWPIRVNSNYMGENKKDVVSLGLNLPLLTAALLEEQNVCMCAAWTMHDRLHHPTSRFLNHTGPLSMLSHPFIIMSILPICNNQVSSYYWLA